MASLRSQIVTRRSYNRPLNAEGTVFETWPQTVARVIRHQRWLWEAAKREALSAKDEDELTALEALMLNREGSVSGRTLWLGGTEIARTRPVSNFSCCGLQVKTVYDIVDVAWLLLNGSGVGFTPATGVLNGFCKPIPNVQIIRSTRNMKGGAENNTETWLHDSKTRIIQVGDSAKAWAKALGKLVGGKHPAETLIIDLSQIRPAGDRLKGYGWISSGDTQLAGAMCGIAEVLNRAAGRLLTAIDILDVVNWMGTILSSRRSAELAMLPAVHDQWEDFALAKRDHFEDNPQRAQSNNSLVFHKKPSREQLEQVFALMVKAGGSEPGIVNGAEALRRAPDFAVLNPCVTGDTRILTSTGYRPIKETVGETVLVWNGEQWSEVEPFSTGVNPVLRVELSDGSELNCTPNHKWLILDGPSTQMGVERRVEAKDLRVGDRLTKYSMPVVTTGEDYRVDAYSQGFYSGDGYRDHTYSYVYAPKYGCMPRLDGYFTPTKTDRIRWVHGRMWDKRFVPINGTLTFCLDWLAGLLDSDGCVTRNPNSTGLQICSVDEKFLNDTRLMLTRLGCTAKVLYGRSARVRAMPDGKGGQKDYACQENFRLCVNASDTTRLVGLGLHCERLDIAHILPQRNACRFVTVVAVTPCEDEETFCFTEPLAHRGTFNGIVTGQCGESLLGDKSLCNLVEVNLAAFNGRFDALREAVYTLARANYRQTVVDLRDGILQETWHELNQYLRLCGVGLTGYMQWEFQDYSVALAELRHAARRGADSMAEELDLPYSKRISLVKPSGTMSKVFDCTEGVHKPLGKYIFNNVNFSASDPLVATLQAAGYHSFVNPYDPTGVVVRLPVCWDNVAFEQVNGMWVNTESAVAQLERYRLLMDCYVDHNVSITVSYDPREIPQIIDWLETHWDQYVSAAFLLRNDPTKTASDLGYPYLPQEVVTQAVYEKYVATLKPVSLQSSDFFAELEDDCASGACPVR